MGSEFDINYGRLKTIIIIFLFMFFVYASELMILGTGDENFNAIGEPFLNGDEIPETEPSIIGGIANALNYIGAFFIFVFQMLTFTLPTIPIWMTAIMLPVMITLIIILVYLIIDMIYAIVKALPLT